MDELLRRLYESSHGSRGRCEALFSLYLRHGALDSAPTRIAVWRMLLGVPLDFDEAGESAAIGKGGHTIERACARVIRKDAGRTRGELPCFKEASGVERVSRLLTYFTLCGHSTRSAGELLHAPVRAVEYRQGLNECLAGVLLASPGAPEAGVEGVSDGLAMALLSRLLTVYAPRVYSAVGANDPDLISLQCSLHLLRLLLLYHDPELATFLQTYHCDMELFAPSWLLTLFARNTSPPCLLALWDFFIVCARRPGPVVLHAVCVAFLMSHRGTILSTPTQGTENCTLPITLARLNWRDVGHVRSVCGRALELVRDSPWSLCTLIGCVAYGGGGGGVGAIAPTPSLLHRLQSQLTVAIPVSEMLAGCGCRYAKVGASDVPGAQSSSSSSSTSSSPGPTSTSSSSFSSPPSFSSSSSRNLHSPKSPPPLRPAAIRAAAQGGLSLLCMEDAQWSACPRYLVLDIRGEDAVARGGKLPTAYTVPPSVLWDAEGLQRTLASFSHLSGTHFAICGEGSESVTYHRPAGEKRPSGSSFGGESVSGSGGGVGGGGGGDGLTLNDLGYGDGEEHVPHPNQDSKSLAVMLIQRGFPRVTEVQGGFTALHQLQAGYLSEVLVGHEAEVCGICARNGGGESPTPPPLTIRLADFLTSPSMLRGGTRHRSYPPPATPTLTPSLVAQGVCGVDEDGRILLTEAKHLDLQLDSIMIRGSGGNNGGGGGGGYWASATKHSKPTTGVKAPPMLAPPSTPHVSGGGGGGRIRAFSGSLGGALSSFLSPPPPGRITPRQ